MSFVSSPFHNKQRYPSRPQVAPTVPVVKMEEVPRDLLATDKGVDDVIDSVASGAGKVWVKTFLFLLQYFVCFFVLQFVH